MNHGSLFSGIKEINAVNRYCVFCGTEFQASRAWQKFCSHKCQEAKRRKDKGLVRDVGRNCKQCGTHFIPVESHQQHCSSDCAKVSARQSRSSFFKRNPGIMKVYYNRTTQKIGKDGNLKRLYKRHPELPRKCQACGEDRVLDVAHKPGHERNGAWRSVKNTTPDKIWILCPTCHALLDRMNYDPQELGLKIK